MSEQKYGVVYDNRIVKVCSTYERALEEAAMFTLETGAQHVVHPVKPKKKESESSEKDARD